MMLELTYDQRDNLINWLVERFDKPNEQKKETQLSFTFQWANRNSIPVSQIREYVHKHECRSDSDVLFYFGVGLLKSDHHPF